MRRFSGRFARRRPLAGPRAKCGVGPSDMLWMPSPQKACKPGTTLRWHSSTARGVAAAFCGVKAAYRGRGFRRSSAAVAPEDRDRAGGSGVGGFSSAHLQAGGHKPAWSRVGDRKVADGTHRIVGPNDHEDMRGTAGHEGRGDVDRQAGPALSTSLPFQPSICRSRLTRSSGSSWRLQRSAGWAPGFPVVAGRPPPSR